MILALFFIFRKKLMDKLDSPTLTRSFMSRIAMLLHRGSHCQKTYARSSSCMTFQEHAVTEQLRVILGVDHSALKSPIANIISEK